LIRRVAIAGPVAESQGEQDSERRLASARSAEDDEPGLGQVPEGFYQVADVVSPPRQRAGQPAVISQLGSAAFHRTVMARDR
jgi:hypothetical protein